MKPSFLVHLERPSYFNETLAEAICNRIADGEWIVRICQNERMPCVRIFWRWLNQYPEFHCNYEMARELYEDYYTAQILEIARATHLPIPERRIRIDALKWAVERMRPPTKIKGS